MARNKEKRLSGLNRFLEAKQKESKGEESTRPPLHLLQTAKDVKKWIPGIRREIDYLLQQMSCPHESRQYSDEKTEQFKERVDQLKKEHDKFVAKVQRLDPSYRDTIPWQPRGYSRKRSHESHVTSSDPHPSGSATKKLCSPLLEKEQRELLCNTYSCRGMGTKEDSKNPLGLDYSSSEDES